MKEMLVSEFKAKCIGALKRIKQTRQPLTVTLRGAPLAVVHPARSGKQAKRLGGQRGAMRIKTELVGKDFTGDWELLR
ncbi:MAG: type II toxin-antitoxin system prevent-host-death family antitoxin [Opitutaceae bacterium]|nr:type II toxin-antitoxin system prevent-host-death family antitoxin [Opitutaceae bacterium]